ncbi:hypothetical protein AB9F46_08520 [Rhizobium leguminosarum]|uniref:hypothetical protein n=1 Tax=Rhizobium leguminosarum TaxID=384 RepID=UPI003F94FAC6
MREYHQRSVEAFLKAIGDLECQLEHVTFNYCTIRQGDKDILLHGRLFFQAGNPLEPYTHFTSASVRAGQYHIKELELTASALIEAILCGKLHCPHGDVYFPEDQGGFSSSFAPLHAEGLSSRNRISVLAVAGAPRSLVMDHELIDWELRGAETPYSSLQELLWGYRLGVPQDRITFEAIIQTPLQVDFSCTVHGQEADVGVLLSKGLSRELASFGFRVIGSDGIVVERGMIRGDALAWDETETRQRGRSILGVPHGSIVECFASYAGAVQHFGFIADPTNVQNDRRSVYESFDPGLGTLREFLFRPVAKGVQARDFEAAVSWLLWMLGFNVATLGFFPKTQEAPDLLVKSPSGHYLVVECTMGMLRAENKLATVVRRATQIKEALSASGNAHLRVIPAMVTSLTGQEVKAEMEAAERSGTYVVTREELERAISTTLVATDPDRLFDEAAEAVATALAKYTSATPASRT